MQAKSSSGSVCVRDRVVAGIDALSLSALVVTDEENVVCVTYCAGVRGLPARPIKSGCFPLTLSTINNC